MFNWFTTSLSGAAGALSSWMVSPWLFLGGAALMSVPIIIHLLNKRRFRRIDWAAMEFLLEADKRNRRRIRLENLILLMLRCLAVLLIGLLVARPFLSAGLAGGLLDAVRYERIVLLDDSVSMEVREGGQSVLENAKDALTKFVNGLSANESQDSFTLVLASQPHQPILSGHPVNAETAPEIARDIDELASSDLPGRMDQALLEIEKSLSETGESVNRVLYVLSDMRQRDWSLAEGENNSAAAGTEKTEAPQPEGQKGVVETLRRISDKTAGCFLIDVAGEGSENLSIADVIPQEKALVAGVASRFEVVVHNSSAANVGPVPVKFTVGDSLPLTAEIPSIPGGQSASVPFTYTFAPVEDDPLLAEAVQPIRIRAEISGDEPVENNRLLADDVRHFPARLIPGIPTLLVDGDPSATYGLSESFFLAEALSPPGPFLSGITVKTVTDTDFETIKLDEFQVVYLLNLYHISEERLASLEKWVRAGGGLVFMLGDQIDDKLYNDQLYNDGDGLMPMALGSLRGDETEETWAHFSVEASNHPVLRVFEGESNPFIQGVKIFQWWESTISEDDEKAGRVSVAARLTDGEKSPAMVEQTFGDGRVVAFTLPADSDWSDWPQDPSYLVAVQELNRYMAQKTAGAGAVSVGEPLQHTIDLTEFRSEGTLSGPGREKTPIQAAPDTATTAGSESLWKFEYEPTDRRGFYELETIRTNGTTERVLFAANIDAAEGDLRRVDPAALRRDLGDAKVQLITGTGLLDLAAEGAKGEFWMYVLLALLTVLCVEQLLAWSFGRRR